MRKRFDLRIARCRSAAAEVQSDLPDEWRLVQQPFEGRELLAGVFAIDPPRVQPDSDAHVFVTAEAPARHREPVGFDRVGEDKRSCRLSVGGDFFAVGHEVQMAVHIVQLGHRPPFAMAGGGTLAVDGYFAEVPVGLVRLAWNTHQGQAFRCALHYIMVADIRIGREGDRVGEGEKLFDAAIDMKDRDVMVSIQHLSKSFGETEVLRDVNLDVKRGEVVVVLGPSGSGKSTMLRCINLLEQPSGGHIYIEGQEITGPKTDVDKLREHVGMVFQQFNLFPHLTAKKNVMLAQRKVLKRSEEEAERVAMLQLERVGLADRADFKPGQLSGGQQQRVAIARALAMDPHVMLFDEATSALDPELVRGV